MIDVETFDPTGPSPALPAGTVAVALPAVPGEEGAPPEIVAGSELARAAGVTTGPLDGTWATRRGFTGKVGQVGTLPGTAADGTPVDVLVAGVGPAEALTSDRGLESVRRAAAAVVRSAGTGERVVLALPTVDGAPAERVAAAAAEGGALASYRFDAYRSADPPVGLDALVLVGAAGDADAVARGAARGSRVARSVGVARDLTNEPPSSLTPSQLAARIADLFAGRDGVTVEVWDEARIHDEHLGGLLGVARGSTQEPRLVRVDYSPPAAPGQGQAGTRPPHVVLVGKGITFDSGGLSLKTASGMETMKTDMGGAAAVLAALDAAVALGSPLRLTAIAPMAENMPGGSAVKPGDVLTARNGKTIEVLNTDAEGRLILADGLSLAAELEPDAIVDVATLTGAAVVKDVAALLGNDVDLLADVRAAGERAGEMVWELPMPDDYRNHIDSEVADMRNVGRPGQAGTIAAAMLLREFVGTVPWAHLDVAGPSRSDESSRYQTKGATGFGVRALVELVTSEDLAARLAGA
jgi:leucyl aminopeptidase